MFFAINSYTNEKLNSLTIQENASYNLIEENILFELKDEIKEIVNLNIKELSKNFQPTCPKCNELMILKKGESNYFWGCPNFPLCRITSSYK